MSIVAATLAGALFHSSGADAQQLSIRRDDVPDGLAHGRVMAIHQDRKGYIWFATHEGLSRFDGYQFTNYGVGDGLGNFFVNAVAEDRRGRLWLGTNGAGVARLLDEPPNQPVDAGQPRKKFVAYRVGETASSNRVNQIAFDADDNLWCLTDAGLFRSTGPADEPTFQLILPGITPVFRQPLYQDRKGRLWFGFREQLVEYDHGTVTRHIPGPHEPRAHEIAEVIEDDRGRLLAVDTFAVYELIESNGQVRWRAIRVQLKPGQTLTCAAAHAGSLWVGSSRGLIRMTGDEQTLYTVDQGLSDDFIAALSVDRDRNLWIATGSRGVSKLSSASAFSVTQKEGMPAANVRVLTESRQGRLYALFDNGTALEIVDGRARPLAAMHPSRALTAMVQDRQGDWWIGTDTGLYRFDGPELQLENGRRFTSADGVNPGPIGAIVEDRSGGVWVTVAEGTSGHYGLYRSDPARERIVRFERATADPLPYLRRIQTDAAGTLWFVGLEYVARLDGKRLVRLQTGQGLPASDARALLRDRRGWLWLGLRYHGLSLTKDDTAETPTWTNYAAENGLASDTVWDLVEGDDGHVYVATGKGLDRFDPSSGRIRHLTSEYVYYCMKDSQGNIWIAGLGTLSKIDPRGLAEAASPPTYFSHVQLEGESMALPETGSVHIPFRNISPDGNLSIDYVALSFQRENALKYQYRLQPVDREWSAPTALRSVNYARLAAGSYRFLVRAINQEGVVSPQPATFDFRVLAPIWQRWWFLALVVNAVVVVGFALHRLRLRQFMAMERVRRQVATDLHDDMGSGLAQVAILSEVARRDASPDGERLMGEVADLARSMRESMDDIVWAVDPRHDKLTDLVARMRQVAHNLIEANGLRVEWHVIEPGELARIDVAPDVRRHLLLIVKEALTNVARHAQATNVRVDVQSSGRNLQLTIKDNGCGFDPDGHAHAHGHGLYGLRERAADLGARLSIDSTPGEGTTVAVVLPLK